MTLLERINNIKWFTLDIELKSILKDILNFSSNVFEEAPLDNNNFLDFNEELSPYNNGIGSPGSINPIINSSVFNSN